MKIFFVTLVSLCVAVLMFTGVAFSATPKTANPEIQPPPYVEGMPQYTILTGKNREFDAFTFNTGPKQQSKEVEGRLWAREYHLQKNLPQGPSALQTIRNYSNFLRSQGATNVVELTQNDVAKQRFPAAAARIVSGSFVKAGKEIWLEAQAQEDTRRYSLVIVEVEAMRQDVGEAPVADEMLRSIRDQGHVTLYINFDTGKWAIKADSLPIIEQVVLMLNNSPELRLRVEGHTDAVGTPESNKILSDNRANAVMQGIVGNGIAANRLTAAGMGQEKPIADNSTEEGRAKNRRVELLKLDN